MSDDNVTKSGGGTSREQQLESVIAQYIRACDSGAEPDRQEIIERHPDLDDLLREFFANRDRMNRFADPFCTATSQTHSKIPPEKIRYFGDYEVLEEIGYGGMGVIYKARQVSLDRIVALKMLREGRLESPDDVQRFRIEAEAAAGLDHPNIVPIYEVGAHEGRQYFSMKLVEGGSLSQCIADRPIPPREAAGLIATVASAVHYAHQRGILHRDLKPANILLDAAGRPLITDFGLAKRVERESELTQTGAVLGTPSYMAPEQASGRSRSLTTATDVYGLGAVLYAVLTGRPPFVGESSLDILTQVRESEPQPPSQGSALVDRDLDTICLKCLEKEPGRRYSSAEAVSVDLQHWLNGEPISARPTGRLRRAVMWARRRPAAAGMIAVSVAALVALTSGLAISNALISRALSERTTALSEKSVALESEKLAKNAEADQRQQADEQRLAAQAAAQAAHESEADTEAFSTFLVDDVLAVARPEGDRGGLGIDVTVREALDAAAPQIADRFDGRPRAEAIARHALGVTYRLIGEFQAAETQLREALRLRQESLGPEDLETLNTQNSLAVVLGAQNRNAEALPLIEHVVRVRKVKLGPEHPETLVTMSNLALGYQRAGRLQEALPLHEATVKLMKEKISPNHVETLRAMSNLADCYKAVGRSELALSLHEDTLKLRKEHLGAEHPDTLRSMSRLAILYRTAGHPQKMVPLAEETLKLRKAKLGPNHRDTLNSMNDLATGYMHAGRSQDAVTLLEETLKRCTERLGPENIDTLATMSNLASAYKAAGRQQEAVQLHEESAKLLKAQLGPNHPTTLVAMNNLALAYQATGRFQEALSLYDETLTFMKASPGPHPNKLRIMTNLALLHRKTDRQRQALPLFEETLQLTKEEFGADHPDSLNFMSILAEAYQDSGRPQDAVPLLEEAVRLSQAKFGADHPDVLNFMNNLAAVYQTVGRLPDAVSLHVQTLKGQQGKLGFEHPTTLTSMNNLAFAYQASGRFGDAVSLYQETLKLMKPDHPNRLTVMKNLGVAHLAAKQPDSAIPLLNEFLVGQRERLGSDTLGFASIQSVIADDLLKYEQYEQAEKVLRECVAILVSKQPDGWPRFDASSMLGSSLAGQKKYSDAEPLLVSGYEGMKERETTIPAQAKFRLRKALQNLVDFYEAWGKPDRSAEWRKELATTIEDRTTNAM